MFQHEADDAQTASLTSLARSLLLTEQIKKATVWVLFLVAFTIYILPCTNTGVQNRCGTASLTTATLKWAPNGRSELKDAVKGIATIAVMMLPIEEKSRRPVVRVW